MVIKASSAAEVRALTEQLRSSDPVRREAAIARLAIIGPRAVDRLCETYATAADDGVRVAVLRALEPIGDPRGLRTAREALNRDGEVGEAAAAVLRTLLQSSDEHAAAAALDALVSVALTPSANRRIRLAAADALQDMPPDARTRLAGALGDDPDPVVLGRLLAAGTSSGEVWDDALQGRLPDDPQVLQEVVTSQGASAPLGSLQKLVDLLRQRETTERDRQAWVAVRGAVHQALAARGSRVAVYDLRETVERSSDPLPVSFLAALQALGDTSCLEATAAAWMRASSGDHWWRDQLASAFRTIATREKITRRHGVMKRLETRWPEVQGLLSPKVLSKPSQTTARPSRGGRT